MANSKNRPAEYVPALAREELEKLSKADLMEMVWSFAQIEVGEDKDHHAVYARVLEEAKALALHNGRKPKSLAPSLAELAKRKLHQIDTAFNPNSQLANPQVNPEGVARLAEKKAKFLEDNASWIAYLDIISMGDEATHNTPTVERYDVIDVRDNESGN